MGSVRLIYLAALSLSLCALSFPARSDTPLITCTGLNKVLQSTGSPPSYNCASITGGLPARFVYSPSITDTALSTDALIQWQSMVNRAKTDVIGAGTYNGQPLVINDGVGTAAQYPITLNATSGITIGGNSSLTLNSNFFTIYLSWDGTSNWIIIGYDNGSQSVAGPNFLMTESNSILTTESGIPLITECHPCSSGR